MNKRQIMSIAVVIAIGAVLGGLILTWDKAAPPDAVPEMPEIKPIPGTKRGNAKSEQIGARVEISDEMLKSIGVEILTAGPGTLRPTLKLPGEIGFDEQTIVRVIPRVPGMVVTVDHVPGQQVQKGEVLAVIDSQVLADLRSQLFAARKRLALARITFEREKQLWEEKISAKQDYLAAQQ